MMLTISALAMINTRRHNMNLARRPAVVTMERRTFMAILSGVLLGALPSAEAQGPGKGLPGAPAPRNVVLELQQALALATARLQAMDAAGVLSYVSDRYRSDSLTKSALRDQLWALFGLYDTLRAKVRIDDVRTVGEDAWVYSTGEVSGRLRVLGTWMPVLSWQHEPEVARREQGVWRLYGNQK
jgi:hypothetical protein